MKRGFIPMGRLFIAALLLAVGLAPVCLADENPLPAYFPLPANVHLKPGLTVEDYGEAEFPILGRPDIPVQRGKHWNGGLVVTGLPDGTDPEVVWAQLKPALVSAGWSFFRDENGQAKTARYQKDGRDSWITIWILATDDIRLDLVEVGPPHVTLALTKPAPTPEKVSADSGDFPYLGPMPGATFAGSQYEDGPMILDVDAGSDQVEQQFIANGSIVKSYSLPENLRSTALFVDVYRKALIHAGWTIVRQIQGVHASDAVLNAHYAADGRDIWASLHTGENYTIRVADVGSVDLAAALDRDCHVALYGIRFDFNKATLRPDSQPTLNKVLSLLKSKVDLKLEVQGHTDNVGSADYNQKLSQARASSVVTWLSTNGIDAARLSPRGYGLTMPIADNGSDEGRAKKSPRRNQKAGMQFRTIEIR